MATPQTVGLMEHIQQTKFLAEKGFMTWKQARDLPQAERDALTEEYKKWVTSQKQKETRQ